jgi:methylase of polypeptide subunit release factors
LELDELGRAGRYAELRLTLETSGYSEPAICARLGLRRLADYEMEPTRRSALPPPVDATDGLIRLFLAGEALQRAALEACLGSTAAALLSSMGLLGTTDDGQVCATVALYPVHGLFIASDRWSHPDGSAFVAPPDTVYPALVRNTRLFLDLLPEAPCERCLDLGSGTGIAAFVASRNGARESWAADIAERSTRFAEFNSRLNDLAGVSTLTSDLYDRLEGRTFDRIVAHPPYMPVLSPKWVFLSGGEDGEEITRRIVEGLPRHLREGGLFCSLTMGTDRGRTDRGATDRGGTDSGGTDRTDAPFELRVRDWLGEAQDEFDVALVVRKHVEPQQFALSTAPFEPRTRADAHAWRELFARLGVVSLVYGFLLIRRRRNRTGPAITIRRTAAPDFSRADWQWMLDWETAAASDRCSAIILDSRLHSSRRAEFEVLHRLTDKGWTPQSYQLRVDRPFEMGCAAEPWAAHLISQCDGQITGRQHFERFVEQGIIPPGTSEADFADAAAPLVSGGFIEVEGFRPPRAGG